MFILHVEDDSGIQELVRDILTAEGHHVVGASNGLIAIQMIKSDLPDLILLDMNMPVMNGREFLEVYKQMAGMQVPVICISADDRPQNIPLMAPVLAWLRKPFTLDHLIDLVRHCVLPIR